MSATTAETQEPKAKSQEPPVRLLSARLTICLAIIAILHALLICWVLATSGSIVPLAGLASPAALSFLACALASILALLMPPFMFPVEGPASESSLTLLQRSIFSSLWQGAVFAFFLLLASRLTPLNSAGILCAAAWIALVALCGNLLTLLWRKAFAGLAFFWLFALPVCCYMLTEVFLMTPSGSSGWQQARGPAAEALRLLVHGSLSLSPASSAAGALTGLLPDGSPYAATMPLTVLAFIDAALAALLLRRHQN
ncbi:MAG TPA: hypothetical protein VGP72_20010 [Planctomycetota bacterium]|jgi:hypothetical protein